MLRTHAHVADLMIDLIYQGDLIGLLEHLHANRKNEGYPVGPTLVARIVKAKVSYRHFAELLHDRRRLGLQDRIGVISDKLEDVVHAIAPRSVRQRGGTRCQGLETGNVWVDPPTGKTRDECGAVRPATGWRHWLPQAGCHSRHCQGHQQKEIPRLRHALL